MKRVLFVNPFGIGDAIFSMTSAEALKKASPDTFIGFVGNERTIGLLRLDRAIDRAYVFNRDYFRSLWPSKPILFFKAVSALLSEIRRERYDTLIDLSLGREFAFFAMLAGIKERIGLDYKRRGLFLTKKVSVAGYGDRAVADHQLDLLEKENVRVQRSAGKLSIVLSEGAEKKASACLKAGGYDPSRRLVALAPGGGKSWGANASYKQWAPDRFAETLNRWADGKKVFILLLGDKEEAALLKTSANSLKTPSLQVAGEDLEVVSALLKRSEYLFCNDGGLLHLANALGVKTLSIFGPVDEKVYGPYGSDTVHQTVSQPVECRPCYKNFRFPPCAHERRCLEELDVQSVLAALEKIA